MVGWTPGPTLLFGELVAELEAANRADRRTLVVLSADNGEDGGWVAPGPGISGHNYGHITIWNYIHA